MLVPLWHPKHCSSLVENSLRLRQPKFPSLMISGNVLPPCLSFDSTDQRLSVGAAACATICLSSFSSRALREPPKW